MDDVHLLLVSITTKHPTECPGLGKDQKPMIGRSEIYLMCERKPALKCPGCQDFIGATQSGSVWVTNLLILWKSPIPAFSSPFAGIFVLTNHKILSQGRCLPSIEFWTSDSFTHSASCTLVSINPSKLHYVLMVPTQPLEAAHQFGKLDLTHNTVYLQFC